MNHPHLQKVLLENRPFRVGQYISKGFHLFSKNLGSFVAYSLLSVLIISMVAGVPLVGGWASKFAMMPVLTAGIYLVVHEVHKREKGGIWRTFSRLSIYYSIGIGFHSN